MITSRNELLRRRLWAYSHGNIRLIPGSISCQVIDALYLKKRKTHSEMCVLLEKDIHTTIIALKKKGLVNQNQYGQYLLTDLGTWLAISRLLGVTFLELCVLASACCVHQRYARSGKTGYYMQPTFEIIFKEFYSKRYISHLFSSLIKKGFAFRYVKKTLRIYQKTCDDLMAGYGKDFKKLESWLDRLEEDKLEILSKALDGVVLGGRADRLIFLTDEILSSDRMNFSISID